MRSTMFAAAIGVLAAQAANAASFNVRQFTGDTAFNTVCAGGSAAGSGNQACEWAVGEIRLGNNAVNGDWEVGVQNPPGTPIDVRQAAFGNGVGYAFSLGYAAATDALALTIGGVTSQTTVDLSGMRSMFIRSRSDSAADTTSLTNLSLNGMAVGVDNIPAGAGSANTAYTVIENFAFDGDWTLTGVSTFAWDGAAPSGSRLASQFKLTDVAPVPLPAAAWMLLSGLGALAAAAGRLRRA